jgi:hypothetical protein
LDAVEDGAVDTPSTRHLDPRHGLHILGHLALLFGGELPAYLLTRFHPGFLEHPTHRRARTAEPLGYLALMESRQIEVGRLAGIERAMSLLVLSRAAEKLQVLWPVVRLVAVDVVDDGGRCHPAVDHSVFENLNLSPGTNCPPEKDVALEVVAPR